MRSLLAAGIVLAIVLAGCTATGPSSPTSTRPSTTRHTSGTSVSTTSGASTTSTSTGSSTDPSGSSSSSTTTSTTAPPTGGDGGSGGVAPPPHTWPSIESARIRPGVPTYTDGGQCTANFVFLGADNETVYIGQAAHCATLGGSTDTNGCQTGSLPVGTAVEVDDLSGQAYHGRLAYSSWLTMQAVHESDAATCAYNDFALVELDDGAAAVTHPAMFRYGGPVGVADATQTHLGDKVLTYGNSGLRFGLSPLSPKEGWIVGPPGSGWTASVYTATPGVPGDSGSGVLDHAGQALGDLVTLSLDGSNGVTILARALPYANAKGGMDVHLATWDLLDPGVLPDL